MQKVSAQSFRNAEEALRAVSLRLQKVHFTFSGLHGTQPPYKCQLTRKPTFEKHFTATVLDEIERLNGMIYGATADALKPALAKVSPQLREAAREEREAGAHPHGGPKERAEGEAFCSAREAILAAKGIPAIRKKRDEMIDGIYERHADSLAVIVDYLPVTRADPIDRNEAKDQESSLARLVVKTIEIQKRVVDLAEWIRDGEASFSRPIGLAKEDEDASNEPPTIESVQRELGITDGMKLQKGAALRYIKRVIATERNIPELSKWKFSTWAAAFKVNRSTITREPGWKQVKTAITALQAWDVSPSTSVERKEKDPSVHGQVRAVKKYQEARLTQGARKT